MWWDMIMKDHDELDQKMIDKPPIGLIPKTIWLELRIKEIVEAMNRYIDVNKPVPTTWVEEYNTIVKDLENKKGSA